MNRLIMAAAAILLASSGCKPIVFYSIQEDQGPGPSQSGPSGGGVIGGVSALAIRGADAPVSFVSTMDPETLVLFFASTPLQCAEPVITFPDVGGPCPGGPGWQLILTIPPELNRPGVVDLDDPRIGFSRTIRLDDCGGGFGYGFGGGYWGTLTILSVDDDSVSVQLSGTAASATVTFDGDYVAERCGPAPVTPPPSPVVATFGAGLSGNPSSGTGPQADPDALYIFGGTSPGTCSEPVPTVDCQSNRQFVFSLPASLRVPGVINLNDPLIDAIHSTPYTSCGPATFDAGTLEITSIDASHIAYAITGAGPSGLNGLYEGAICP
jgi:hypothetical protein